MSMTDTLVAARIEEIDNMIRTGEEAEKAAEKMLADSINVRQKELNELQEHIKKQCAIIEHLEKRHEEARCAEQQAAAALSAARSAVAKCKSGTKEAHEASENVAACEKEYARMSAIRQTIEKTLAKEKDVKEKLIVVEKRVLEDLERLKNGGESNMREARERNREERVRLQQQKELLLRLKGERGM